MSEQRSDQYQTAYMADYGFESTMVRYRRRYQLELLNSLKPKVVVEIGCGLELLYKEWIDGGGYADYWLIVEPADQFVRVANASELLNLHVIQGFFENTLNTIKNALPRQPDLVICSSLLHEVPSASALLQAILEILGDRSLLHLNVPNAGSLHRRLAVAMGLIADTAVMSTRNINLLQHRVYDLQTLKTELQVAGLEVTRTGGCFIKPFTHAQMEKIITLLDESILDGLYKLGIEIPDLASEIFIEACRRDGE